MGFSSYGSMVLEKVSEKDIREFLKIYFCVWLDTINHKNYKKNVYPVEIKKYRTLNKSLDSLNEKDLIKEKTETNNYIIWELKTIKSLLSNIEIIFDYFKINPQRAGSVKDWTENNSFLFHGNNLGHFLKYAKDKKQPKPIQESEIFNVINNCEKAILEYFLCILYLDFSKSEEFLESKFDHTLIKITQPEFDNPNPFPLIFTGIDSKNFTLFKTFSEQHVLDKYVDYSFIFQQMKFHGYILDIKHIKFMEWLYENDYLNEKEYSDFKIEKSFRSLKKCAFGTRVDLYLKLENSIILSNSDLSE